MTDLVCDAQNDWIYVSLLFDLFKSATFVLDKVKDNEKGSLHLNSVYSRVGRTSRGLRRSNVKEKEHKETSFISFYHPGQQNRDGPSEHQDLLWTT